MISTLALKEIAKKMEDNEPAKVMIMNLPDQIDRKELALKFDMIWPFLASNKGGEKK